MVIDFKRLLLFIDNFYGTPKPPAEPSALLLNVTDQLLPGARPSSEGKRKRNKSVSNMEKTSIEPPEEEEEERPIVNGNGVAVTPGQLQQPSPRRQRSRVAGAPSAVMTAEGAGGVRRGQADRQKPIGLFQLWQWAPLERLPSNKVIWWRIMTFNWLHKYLYAVE